MTDGIEALPVVVVALDWWAPVAVDVNLGVPQAVARAVATASDAVPHADGVWCTVAIDGTKVSVRAIRLRLSDGTDLPVMLAVRPGFEARPACVIDTISLRRVGRA